MSNIFVVLFFCLLSTNILFLANVAVVYVFSHSVTPINFPQEPLDTIFSPEPGDSRFLRNFRLYRTILCYDRIDIKRSYRSSFSCPRNEGILGKWKYRVIRKSLRDFRTRLRNNQDRHGRKEHINR